MQTLPKTNLTFIIDSASWLLEHRHWRAVDPILGDGTPVHPYEPGTRGPGEALQFIGSDGRWVIPTVHEEQCLRD
jgi:hypothetical protein